LLLLVALTSLYAAALRTGFLSDDYVFLEEVRSHGFPRSLFFTDPLGNFFRPVSRQLYFTLLEPLAKAGPLPLHLVNFGLFLGALSLLYDLIRAWAPRPAALVGVTYFALLHGQRLLLTWVSCSQDLLALLFALGAVALFRRGRLGWAVGAYALAISSKESALPLPAALLLWDRWREGRSWRSALARVAGFAVVLALWGAAVWGRYPRQTGPGLLLQPGLSEVMAACVHMVQSLLFLEHPPRWTEQLLEHAPPWAALVPLLGLAPWFPKRAQATAGREAAPALEAHRIAWGAAWCGLFVLPVAFVAHTWSAYYYTLAAVGAALIVAALAVRLDRWGWLILAPVLLWLHAGASGARAFAIVDRPWVWTSHLTPFYFERGAAYAARLSGEVRQLAPSPPAQSRFFFATLPYFAGFQMGNGPLLRDLYRDATLQSHFYSRFSDSTAGFHPCDFFYWDGERLRRLYPAARGRFTQVAGDLLLLGRHAGAIHALRRATDAGEDPHEIRYWLGWTRLSAGNRAAAEEAWRLMGARDDPERYWRSIAAGDSALARGDTVAAHRAWLAAIPRHLGRPEAHRRLGALLFDREPKYALLELNVAVALDPSDLDSRRLLARGLSRLGMHEPALANVEELWGEDPSLRSDPDLVAVARAAHAAASGGRDVAEFPREEVARMRRAR
jgi:tetratricopeptide (TPR) repeat protein